MIIVRPSEPSSGQSLKLPAIISSLLSGFISGVIAFTSNAAITTTSTTNITTSLQPPPTEPILSLPPTPSPHSSPLLKASQIDHYHYHHHCSYKLHYHYNTAKQRKSHLKSLHQLTPQKSHINPLKRATQPITSHCTPLNA